MTTPGRSSAPTRDIGQPDLGWGTTWGQGLLADWWETTADLIWPQSMITYGRMRHDLQIKAVLASYKLPILRATWAVDPEGCRDEVVQHVSDDLGIGILGTDFVPGPARRRGVIWHRHLREALHHLTYGHMIFERRYEIQPDGYVKLIHLGQRMPWTVATMDVGPDGVMRSIKQTTQADPIPANRLVWYVADQEGGNWAGISPLRACFGAWLLKHEAWRVNATSIRRFGMGVPVVTAPAGGSAAQVQQAQMLASAMRGGDQAGVGLPQGFTPSLMGLSGGTPDAIAFIKYLDQSIAKSALAGLIELGQTETGSRALGESFLDLFTLALQGVADDVATTATSGHEGMPGIVTDLVDQNWGPDEPAPRIVCTDVGENYDASADAITALIAARALTPDRDLEEWIRKTWRLPAKGGPSNLPPEAPPPQTVRQILTPGGEGQPPSIKPPSLQPAPQASARRGLTAREIQCGFRADAHQREWQTALDGLVTDYRRVTDRQRMDLVDQVDAAGKRPDKLALDAPPLGDGPVLVSNVMFAVAVEAAKGMLDEAAGQGVTIEPHRVKIDAVKLSRIATARTTVAAQQMAQAASSKALQVAAAADEPPPPQNQPPPPPPPPPGNAVAVFLDGLSDQNLREQLGAALTAAQNEGRVAVLEAAPESAGQAVYVATEILDQNTCEPCRRIDQSEFGTLAEASAAYPTGGYEGCLGLLRCRGTVMAVWEPQPVAASVSGIDIVLAAIANGAINAVVKFGLDRVAEAMKSRSRRPPENEAEEEQYRKAEELLNQDGPKDYLAKWLATTGDAGPKGQGST